MSPTPSCRPEEEPPTCEEWVDGDPIPTGEYELRVHAVAPDGEEHTTSTQVRLERRAAAELLTPGAGDVVSRHQAFVIRTAEGFPEDILGVEICVAELCDFINEPSADGTWRAAFDTSGLENGEAEVFFQVNFAWNAGEWWEVDHRWTGSSTVTISDVAPELALTADPSHGDVPLNSTVTIDATDSVGPLGYTLRYGDGTEAVVGTIESPYAAVQHTHTYVDPGVHHANVVVTDQDGNSVQRTVDVVATRAVEPPPTHGTLKVRIATAPATDEGRFNLLVDGSRVKARVRNGDGTVPLTVTAGTHTVAVSAGEVTPMVNYVPSIGCVDGDGAVVVPVHDTAGVTVQVNGGTDVVCTILNTRRTTYLGVELAGTGTGTVTSSPAGISCGGRPAPPASDEAARSGSPPCRRPARPSTAGRSSRATAPATARSRSTPTPASPFALTSRRTS